MFASAVSANHAGVAVTEAATTSVVGGGDAGDGGVLAMVTASHGLTRPIDRVLMAADLDERPRLRELHAALLCGCCRGYLVNAVKIDDCLHSFCRSCIVQYISSKTEKKQCPTCLSSASAGDKPYPNVEKSNLVPDRVLQSCVYKLVPGLYRSEQQRQTEFYRTQGMVYQTATKPEDTPLFLSPDELISLSLEYECTEDWNENKPKIEKRYLQCPAAVTISHIEKLLRLKYSIYPSMAIEIRYKKRTLCHQLSLMDVVYIHGWQRDTPMDFTYCITRPVIDTKPVNVVAEKVPSSPPPRISSPVKPAPAEKLCPPPPRPAPVAETKTQPVAAAAAARQPAGRMIYDPDNRAAPPVSPNMQPRVELTEYARNIGLTAVKNGSSHYDFRVDKVERDDDHVEFAKKRDREWAAQKQLDDNARHSGKDDNAHRKRKKAKHSKNDDAAPKRRKLHAQITSPESPEDALKMKVKLTPTPASKHKHKHHAEPIVRPPPLLQPVSTSAPDSKSGDLSTKEKLLQMRAVRRDKHVNPAAPVQKTSEPTTPANVVPATPLPPPKPVPKPIIKPPVTDTPATPTSNVASEVPAKRPLPVENTKTEPPTVKLKDDPKVVPAKPQSSSKDSVLPKTTSSTTSITDKIPNLIECKPKTNTSDTKETVSLSKTEVKPNVSSSMQNDVAKPIVAPPPKVIRPPPATIPLVRIKKSVNKSVTFSTPDKNNAAIAKTLPSPTTPQKSEAVNPVCDNIGALDLSGKSSRSPTSETQPASSPSPPAPSRILNGVMKVKKPLEKPNVNPMSNLQMLSESAVQILSQSKTTVSRMPIKQQTLHNPTVRTSVPMNLRIPTPRPTYKPMNPILKLNEIKGPRSINPRPQNQTVRSIPNPSALTFRPTQAKPVQEDSTKTPNSNSARPPVSSATTDIKKIENIAKNLNLEKVTAELVGRASEANKLNVKTTSQTTP